MSSHHHQKKKKEEEKRRRIIITYDESPSFRYGGELIAYYALPAEKGNPCFLHQ